MNINFHLSAVTGVMFSANFAENYTKSRFFVIFSKINTKHDPRDSSEVKINVQKLLYVVFGQFLTFFEKSSIFGPKMADKMGMKKKFKNLRNTSC